MESVGELIEIWQVPARFATRVIGDAVVEEVMLQMVGVRFVKLEMPLVGVFCVHVRVVVGGLDMFQVVFDGL